MVVAIGLLSVIAGAVVACAAERFPTRAQSLETGAGFLLLSGFALSSYALPAIL